nr:MAG TPA: hypothetical protein [Caudoviricetes sp.]
MSVREPKQPPLCLTGFDTGDCVSVIGGCFYRGRYRLAAVSGS